MHESIELNSVNFRCGAIAYTVDNAKTQVNWPGVAWIETHEHELKIFNYFIPRLLATHFLYTETSKTGAMILFTVAAN